MHEDNVGTKTPDIVGAKTPDNVGAETPQEGSEIKYAASLSTDMADSEKQIEQPTPQATQVTDWDGPDDPGNPHNWPMWSRLYHCVVPGLFGFVVYILAL